MTYFHGMVLNCLPKFITGWFPHVKSLFSVSMSREAKNKAAILLETTLMLLPELLQIQWLVIKSIQIQDC